MNFEVNKLPLQGALLIIPPVFFDSRGYFSEAYHALKYQDILPAGVVFVQDNLSQSSFGVIRGLHFQKEPYSQSKLVRCVWGTILDVAVDIRPGSCTYGQHVSVLLSAENANQVFIPKGFAHGFSVLSAVAVVEYKCDAYYAPEADSGIRYDDPDLNIDWKIEMGERIVSPKDAALQYFSDLTKGRT